MTMMLALTTVALAAVVVFLEVMYLNAKINAERYRSLWTEAISERGAEDSLIYEWSNRDLMPEWEDAYPHVKQMPERRKYSEWATFCANYPTREQMIAQISLDGSARVARELREG